MTQISYDQFIQNLHNAGINTTNIREGKEANFADYGNALSTELKQEIMDSFDCEQDYQIQSMIAGLYDDNKSVLQSGEFVKACKSMGLNVEISYQKTSYISDYKAGNFDNSVGTGHIAVYTISDGMGGEIKIADANGNGALESEEIFMNQILGDINYEISVQQGVSVGNSGSSSSANSDSGISILEKVKEVSQSDFDKEVEKYISMGYSKDSAERAANRELKTENAMSYTGTEKDRFEIAEEEKAEKEEKAKKEEEETTAVNTDKLINETVAKAENKIGEVTTEVRAEITEMVHNSISAGEADNAAINAALADIIEEQEEKEEEENIFLAA